MNRMIRKILPPLIVVLAILAGWQLIVWAFEIHPQILPGPLKVFETLLSAKAPIFEHTLITFQRTLIGFGIGIALGVGLGLAIGYSATVNMALYPIIAAVYCMPKAVFLPVLVLWIGLGTGPAIVLSFLIAFFPVLVNVATGVSTIDPEMAEVFRSLGGTKRQIFLKVGIPGSLPYFFGALKIAGPSALVGVIVSEMIASTNGMGYVLMLAGTSFNISLMFADIFAMAILGIVIYLVCEYANRKFAWWAYQGSSSL